MLSDLNTFLGVFSPKGDWFSKNVISKPFSCIETSLGLVDMFAGNLVQIDRVVFSLALSTDNHLVKNTLLWAQGTLKQIFPQKS